MQAVRIALVLVAAWLLLMSVTIAFASPYTAASALAEVLGQPPPGATHDQILQYLLDRRLAHGAMLVLPSFVVLVLALVLAVKRET